MNIDTVKLQNSVHIMLNLFKFQLINAVLSKEKNSHSPERKTIYTSLYFELLNHVPSN